MVIKSIAENEVALSATPVNNMGSSSSTTGTGAIDTIDKFLKKAKKPLRSIIKRTKV